MLSKPPQPALNCNAETGQSSLRLTTHSERAGSSEDKRAPTSLLTPTAAVRTATGSGGTDSSGNQGVKMLWERHALFPRVVPAAAFNYTEFSRLVRRARCGAASLLRSVSGCF